MDEQQGDLLHFLTVVGSGAKYYDKKGGVRKICQVVMSLLRNDLFGCL
jgi:hypothetical protein